MTRLKKILDWLLPHYCALCRNPTANNALCTPCRQELPWLENACMRCANPLEQLPAPICGSCLQNPPLHQLLLAPLEYKSPVDHLVLGLKFSQKLAYASLLGEILATAVTQYYGLQRNLPELIIPVPLHTQRLRERGYNQALEIAKTVHRKLGIPLSANQCLRQIATRPQADIPASERKRNVKRAFSLISTLKAGHLAIIDDVVTTGNTVHELTQLLQQHGVHTIDIWCCARTRLRTPYSS